MSTMFPSEIAKEDIKHLPLIRFGGKIHLVDSEKSMLAAMQLLEHEMILGFDTETKPTFNKGEYNQTALIQLSTLTDAFIIRIKDLGISNLLKNLLEDPDIVKVGISIRDDLKELKKCRNFRPAGFVDLNDIAGELGIRQIGMKSLSGIFLKSRISKSQQTSNWESRELTTGQLSYAATDAWVCIKIYKMLLDKGYI
ncbi:3'-5' exonuclease [Marinoscillum furvescens]|uniref:3'-5' exonuclease n=1 Tax=Marinoscillum furvescens DSM 4134 TaxID=1122208 RepID=A0A3D9L6D5_MARFU|nr:3'-5' exonuclease [Marinoscillum furvescens]REE01034.1 3'-5' exonuclease [Marinoscillum furvescens DSM 4134]